MDIGSILLGQMENDVKMLRQEIEQIYAEIKDISMKIKELNQERSEKEKNLNQIDYELMNLNREIEENINTISPRELKTLIAELRIKMSELECKKNLVLQEIAFIDDKIRKCGRDINKLYNKRDIIVMEIEENLSSIERLKKNN
jgi:chromosome segregation ATPase